MKKIFFSVFLIIGLVTVLEAQNMYVHKVDGSVLTVELNSIDSITFRESEFILFEPFNGDILNSVLWDIFDNTAYHETGLNMYVDDTLVIERGPYNDNNGDYGVISKNQFINVTEASVDVFLSSLHNSQDVKVIFHTPIAEMGYYNVSASWFVNFNNSDGEFQQIFFSDNYVPDIKYSLRTRISGNKLIFEWNIGSGFVEVYSTTDFSADFGLQWPDTYKRVKLATSDRGYTKYDNLILR